MDIQSKIEQLEKQLAELKQEVSRNNRKTTINSLEDAFNLLKPEWYIGNCGNIGEISGVANFYNNQCNMTSEKRAKQIKALIELHLIAEAMNKGVEVIDGILWFIVNSKNNLIIDWGHSECSQFIVFPTFNTKALAEEALEKFKDLFKDLYMLND